MGGSGGWVLVGVASIPGDGIVWIGVAVAVADEGEVGDAGAA